MNKNRIRLTESQLHRVITESVKNVLGNFKDNYLSLDPSSHREHRIANRKRDDIKRKVQSLIADLNEFATDSNAVYNGELYSAEEYVTNAIQALEQLDAKLKVYDNSYFD